jgi:hypothetical protein
VVWTTALRRTLTSESRRWKADTSGLGRQVVRSTGFEPVTVRLEGGCSIQLSYERVCQDFLGSHRATVKIRLEKSDKFVCRLSGISTTMYEETFTCHGGLHTYSEN